MCIIEFVGLLFAAFGALFSAFPWRGLDSVVRCCKYKTANLALERLKEGREISGIELNWLLKSEARTLHLREGEGIYCNIETGAIVPGGQLILDERGGSVGSVDIAQRELDARIRNARVYIGLGIAAIGFALQTVAVGISYFA